jgi:hypothetical protein
MCLKGKRRARMYQYQRANVLKLYLTLSTGHCSLYCMPWKPNLKANLKAEKAECSWPV